jgi:hypothetical protein
LVPNVSVLAGQTVQLELPVVSLYVSAAQLAHMPPLAPVYPALQAQSLIETLADGEIELLGHAEHVPEVFAPTAPEYELAGHATQVPAEFAAAVNEYVPAEQSTHPVVPLTVLYLPATQAEHVPPFAPVYPELQVQAAMLELEVGAFA